MPDLPAADIGVQRRPLSRRQLLQWSSGLAGATLLGFPARAAASTALVSARPADDVVEGMGARIATFEGNGSAYKDVTQVCEAVAYIGLRYSRELGVLPSRNATIAARQKELWDLLAGLGCRTLTRVGDADGGSGQVSEFAAYHKSAWGSEAGSVLWGVENGNEWNSDKYGPGEGTGYSPVTGIAYSSTYPLWAEQLALWQRQMWSCYRSEPVLQGLAIVGPPLGGVGDGLLRSNQLLVDTADAAYGGSGGIKQYLTHSSFHLYPGAAAVMSKPSVPSWQLDNKVAAAKIQAPDLPILCSEMGVHNALAQPNENFSAHSLTAGGIYAPRMVLEHLVRGVSRHWYFELVDDYPNPALDTRESHFGLFANDWAPKPAAQAWKNLVALFADPGPSFAPAGAQMSISTADSALRSMLFQKRNGTNLLALWRDVSVYDYVTQTDLTVPAQRVSVTLGTPSRVQVFRPSRSSLPRRDFGFEITSFTVGVKGDVVIVKIS